MGRKTFEYLALDYNIKKETYLQQCFNGAMQHSTCFILNYIVRKKGDTNILMQGSR